MLSAVKIGAVVIGRNEGQRLIRCLESMKHEVARVVYVDSGSTDGSVENALALGAECVVLDSNVPFTAARARNAGFARLMASDTPPDVVQFVDGDCRLEQEYLIQAAAELAENEDLAIVTGWCVEIDPEASIYNAMCDFEWRGPVGDITASGGNMMVRCIAFEQVGGFDPGVIAAEDDEFCVRLRRIGWRLRRIPLTMVHHDAHMHHFAQWWRRAVRTGHAFEHVNDMHPDYFIQERRRIWFYGLLLPVLALVGAFFWLPLLLAVLALYILSYARTIQGLVRNGLSVTRAAHFAVFLSLSKFAGIVGAVTYRARKYKGDQMRIIEHR